MNQKIGMAGSLISSISVALFAVFMLIAFNFGSFFVCIFLALGFVLMISTFAHESEPDRKAAANVALIFAAVYCVMILLVYFAQTTSVRLDSLNEQAIQLIDYSKSGLYFNYDLLGYGLMALSTFFIGLTIRANTKADKWLKWLLILHGAFFIPCLIVPMLGIFSSDGYWTGVIVLEFWCAYFIPLCILSYVHFKKRTE
ncbi:hypothetical protein [Oscillibacter sp.]|uniref:hypothetical protein n=1 Tax=Oscillibacter sp. TaxID=1945593 RepID=UPI00289FC552|nr:hypothetical protein [Oscillibacter sp.]